MASHSTDRGHALALAAALVLSFTGILIRHIAVAHGLPPLELAFWRSAFVVMTLGPWLVLRRRAPASRSRAWRRPVLLLGLCLGAMNISWTISVARIGASLGTVLIYTSGAFTAALSALLFRERLGPARGAAIALCLLGCALVSGALGGGTGPDAQAVASPDPLGIALGVLSGLAYAAYGLAGREAGRQGVEAFTGVHHAFAISGLITAGALLLQSAAGAGQVRLLRLGGDAAGWADLAILAAGPTVVGFALYNQSLKYLSAGVANLIVTLEPPLTAAIAWAVLGERLSGAAWAGSALILLGVVTLRLEEGPTPPP